MAMVQFKCGEYNGFKALKSYEQGTIYVTTDEQGIYFAKDNNTAVKLGNIITYDTLKGFTDSTKPPYSSDVFYYITESNALIKYNGTKFVQINSVSAQDISDIRAIIGSKTDAVTTTTVWGQINKALADAAAASTAASTADGKAVAAQGTADSALAKANGNAGEITTIKNNITTINGDITGLKTIVETGDNSNAKLRTDITTNSTAAANAQAKANEAYALAEVADGKADTNADNIGKINTAIGNDTTANSIKGRIKANENAIGTINTAIGNDSITGSIKGRIKANEEAIAGHGTAISSIQKNYATKKYAEDEADAAESAAKSHADTEIGKAKTALIGTGTIKATDDTIRGAKKYTDEKIAVVNTSISTLSSQIGNLSNIMNFRGTFTSTNAVTDPINGDVIIVNGIEYVYVKESEAATGKWEAFGAATANEARFSAIEDAADRLANRVTALDKAETGKIAVIEGRLTATEGVANGAATGVATLNGKVKTLEETTIPAINVKIGTVASNKNLAQMIADEEKRAKGIENGLQNAINTINNTTVPAINTAHNELAARVTALDKADGRVATVESAVSTLNTKTGIGSLTGDDTLYGMITAETARATAKEKNIRVDFAAADATLDSKFTKALTWGSF